MNTEFKVLTHLGQYVDANLLMKDIYTSSKPFIYPIDTSIELLLKMGQQMKDLAGNNFVNDKYFESLQQCELIPIYTFTDSSQLLKQRDEMITAIKDTYLHLEALGRQTSDEDFKPGIFGRAKVLRNLIESTNP